MLNATHEKEFPTSNPAFVHRNLLCCTCSQPSSSAFLPENHHTKIEDCNFSHCTFQTPELCISDHPLQNTSVATSIVITSSLKAMNHHPLQTTSAALWTITFSSPNAYNFINWNRISQKLPSFQQYLPLNNKKKRVYQSYIQSTGNVLCLDFLDTLVYLPFRIPDQI